MAARLILDGRVFDADSDVPLAGMAVTVTMRSALPLSGAITGGDGAFRLEIPWAGMAAPDVTLAFAVGLDRDGPPIHRTVPVPLSELAADDLHIAVPGADLASVLARGDLVLTTDSGASQRLAVGESLLLSADHVRP